MTAHHPAQDAAQNSGQDVAGSPAEGTGSGPVSVLAADREPGAVSGRVHLVGVVQTDHGPRLAPSLLPARQVEALEPHLKTLGLTGALDEVRRLPAPAGSEAELLVLVGLGRWPEEEEERVRRLRYAAGSAARQLEGLDSVAADLPATTGAEAAAVAEGFALGAFTDHGLRTKARPGQPVREVLVLSEADPESLEPALDRAAVLGEAVAHTRLLVNEPPNRLYPDSFVGRVLERIAATDGVEAEILDLEALRAGGFGGIVGVGQGSQRDPRMVRVEYSPAQARRHVALVGKGITFDSGGLSLKPGASMMTMKSDMAGAAAVLNVVVAAAELGLPVKVTGYLCLAENLPSGTATRPEDVLVMRDGQTVEVLNTDAEGRLVMADGLAWASESAPDYLLDVATLTGAQMVALGARVAAVMGEPDLRARVVEAAERAGESFWAMPLPPEMAEELKSPVADLKNIGAGRNGGMLLAGLFLQEFVGTNAHGTIPWAHLDIAGPSFNEGAPYGWTPKNGTGSAVATLLRLLEDLAQAE